MDSINDSFEINNENYSPYLEKFRSTTSRATNF